ncbi:hypothetical protein K493DRAFT_301219 [Basidiobolus meristosporus CBS 931.73]|uniref:Carbohydrate-binding module family 19 domain-containing protein n=1 Tax=Basidiobolus meristosporus CBS 931.73 TaxID=1314790 RepID=A0A1Y1YD29_9FUNG|nr:hypothetical protein K493DRAFT_301219 [Basidiobolus meristosporus CBS 931.73]|eukprot:ORX95845.1 hypothetical protein K493DRAFT_301219 [Basidiobolus meristosporus CBS 931.73]
MRIQVSVTTLGLLALCSVQVIAQDITTTETPNSVPVSSITQSVASGITPDPTQAPLPTSASSAVDSSAVVPTQSEEPSTSDTAEATQTADPTSSGGSETTQSESIAVSATTEPTQPDSIQTPESTPTEAPSSSVEGSVMNPSSTPEASSATTESEHDAQPTDASTGQDGCQEGQYKCVDASSPQFQWCVAGKWTQYACAEGTMCQSVEGGGIACDWPIYA